MQLVLQQATTSPAIAAPSASPLIKAASHSTTARDSPPAPTPKNDESDKPRAHDLQLSPDNSASWSDEPSPAPLHINTTPQVSLYHSIESYSEMSFEIKNVNNGVFQLET